MKKYLFHNIQTDSAQDVVESTSLLQERYMELEKDCKTQAVAAILIKGKKNDDTHEAIHMGAAENKDKENTAVVPHHESQM